MPQIDLETMTTWTLDEIRASITLMLPKDWTFTLSDEGEEVWRVVIQDDQGEVAWDDAYPEPRLVLFNAYGYLWRRSYVPAHPMWQRRRDDLREVARRGMMHVPGAEGIPDPGDFDPDSVYGLDEQQKGSK